MSISVYLRPITKNLNHLNTDNESSTDKNILSKNDNGNINAEEDNNNENDINITNLIRYCSEIATLMGVLSYVIFQQGDEIKNQGLAAFTKQLVCLIFYSKIYLIKIKFCEKF